MRQGIDVSGGFGGLKVRRKGLLLKKSAAHAGKFNDISP